MKTSSKYLLNEIVEGILCLNLLKQRFQSTKISINIFDVSKGGWGGLEGNVKLTFLVGKIDM